MTLNCIFDLKATIEATDIRNNFPCSIYYYQNNNYFVSSVKFIHYISYFAVAYYKKYEYMPYNNA